MSNTPPSSSASSRSAKDGVRVAGFILGAMLFGMLIIYLGRAVGTGDLALERMRPGPLLVSFVLLLGAYAAQAYAWHLLVLAAGGTDRVTVDCGRWALSLLGKYVPGKVFHAVGRLLLYRGSTPGTAGMVGAFVAESLLSLTAAACVAAVALALVSESAPAPALVVASCSAVGGVAISFSALFDRAAGWLAASVLRTSPPAPIARRRRVASFALQAGSCALLGIGLYALTLAWHQDDHLPVAAIVGALCLSGIAGIVAFVVPAGIGVREVVLVWMLAAFTNPAFAVLIAVASRVWLTAGDAIAVSVGAWLLRPKRKTEGK